jgi:hypothetical protein
MFKTYDEYVKFRNSTPTGTFYDVEALSTSVKSLFAQKRWNSKEIAQRVGMSVVSVHKAAQGEPLTRYRFIDGKWTKVIDDEALSKLTNFLRSELDQADK